MYNGHTSRPSDDDEVDGDTVPGVADVETARTGDAAREFGDDDSAICFFPDVDDNEDDDEEDEEDDDDCAFVLFMMVDWLTALSID